MRPNKGNTPVPPRRPRSGDRVPTLIACGCLLSLLLGIGGVGGCIALESHYIHKASLLSQANALRPLMKYDDVLAILPTNRLETIRRQAAHSPGWSGAVVLNSNITVATELFCGARAEGGFFGTAYPDALHIYFNEKDELVAVYFKPYYHQWKPTWGTQVDIKCDGGALVPSERK